MLHARPAHKGCGAREHVLPQTLPFHRAGVCQRGHFVRPEQGPRVRHHKARSARRPVEGDAA